MSARAEFKAGFFPGAAPPPNGHATRTVSLVPSHRAAPRPGPRRRGPGRDHVLRPARGLEGAEAARGRDQAGQGRGDPRARARLGPAQQRGEHPRRRAGALELHLGLRLRRPAPARGAEDDPHRVRLRRQARQGRALIAEIEGAFAALAPPPTPHRAAYLIWRDPWTTVGHDTFIHDLLARAGFANVFADPPRYPEVDAAALRAAAPEVVLLSSEPFPFKAQHEAELRAVLPDAEIRHVDGELCSWYGSRPRHTPAYLRSLLGS